MDDVSGLVTESARLITHAACEEPPQPPQGLLDDPKAHKRDRLWYWLVRTFVGIILVGIIAFACWLFLTFS